MNSFILTPKVIPDLLAFHNLLIEEIFEFEGISVEPNGDVRIMLSVPPDQILIDAVEAIVPPTTPMNTLINERIFEYQTYAADLLREIYTSNTLEGITVAQSAQMVDDYFDILLMIKEGLFPTAVYRLQQKTPSGFVTQAKIDYWINVIQSYMG